MENGMALYLKIKMNPLYLRMICAKFGWNWLGDSWEEDFLISKCNHKQYCKMITFLVTCKEVRLQSLQQRIASWINLIQFFFCNNHNRNNSIHFFFKNQHHAVFKSLFILYQWHCMDAYPKIFGHVGSLDL